MTLYAIGYLAKLHGVSTSTIRRWEAVGLIAASERTKGGHRRFRIEDEGEGVERKVVGYARVSSYDQKEDLQRQIERLQGSGCDEVLSDIGSGLNCKKPGLRSLLKKILCGRVAAVVVTHEDRLLRFGVDLMRYLCRFMKTELKVLMSPPEKTFEEELAKDVITLMTVFCARLYGRRSRKNQRRPTDNKRKFENLNNKMIYSEPSATASVIKGDDSKQYDRYSVFV